MSAGPIMGIDPGVNGAIATLDPHTWRLVVIDTPKRQIVVNGKDREEVDTHLLSRYIRANKPRVIVSERLWGRPGQDSKGTFSLGRYFGQIEQAAVDYDIQHLCITPQEWKKRMLVSADGDQIRARASALIPAAAHLFKRKKDHDRAEAAMLALFGAFWLGIVPEPISVAEAA